MVNNGLVAVGVTIIPAVAALWYLLKRYEDYFEDSRVFLALTFGFFAGLVAVSLEAFLFPFQDPRFVAALGAGTAFLFFVVGYALFETGAKVVVLGTKKFRNRKDTPYYGAALGLGFGAMMAMGFVALNLNANRILAAQTNATLEGYTTGGFLTMVAVPLGAVFVHGAAGVYVGRGVADGKLWRGWIVGALLQMPVLGAYWLFWPSIGLGQSVVLFPAALSMVYGLTLMHIARVRVLDAIVPKHIQDQVRRARRREQRGFEEE